LVGCGEGVNLFQEREDGGVISCPFTGEQGEMLSSFRTDALALMREKCGGPYAIVQEGETRNRTCITSSEKAHRKSYRKAVGHPISV